MVKKSEPQPNIKLKKRKKPLQKITITSMSVDMHKELQRRAAKYNKKVKDYCRIVLEHAIEHKNDYKGPINKTYNENVCVSDNIHIPLYDKEFKEELIEWDPYGVKFQPEIVKSLLKKHIEVRTW